MIDQTNVLPEVGLKYSSETSRYVENKWIGRKKYKLYFIHFIDYIRVVLRDY